MLAKRARVAAEKAAATEAKQKQAAAAKKQTATAKKQTAAAKQQTATAKQQTATAKNRAAAAKKAELNVSSAYVKKEVEKLRSPSDMSWGAQMYRASRGMVTAADVSTLSDAARNLALSRSPELAAGLSAAQKTDPDTVEAVVRGARGTSAPHATRFVHWPHNWSVEKRWEPVWASNTEARLLRERSFGVYK